jgi:LuxR family maltose regulon positive regulatory protein
LMETSILDRMCGDLCDALRLDKDATSDSQAILAHLERANLFIIPLDDEQRWYRYHHLLADLLKNNLRQHKSSEGIRELHRRASRWHQAEGSLEEAMVHAMAAGEFEQAASMIEENIVSMLARSEAPALLSWIEKLPAQIVRRRPWVDVYRANTLALSGRLEEMEPLLADVEKRLEHDAAPTSEILGHIAAIRAYAANLRDDAARVIEMTDLAESYLPGEHLTARGMAAFALAETCFACDDMDGASRASLKMLEVGEKTGRLLMAVPALCNLAATEKVRGKLRQADALYDRARQWMVERSGLESRLRCPYEVGLADLLREWDQLDAAHEHAMAGIESSRRFGVYSILITGYVTLMRILQTQGNVEGALDALHEAEQIMQTRHHRMAARNEFKAARVVQWLAVGDVDMAGRRAEECTGGTELEQLALTRLYLAQGRDADALHLLEAQQALAEVGGRAGRRIEILSLQALALDAQGRSEEAEATLSQALSLGRPEGYKRLFLDMGEPAHHMLGRLANQDAKRDRNALEQIIADYASDLLDESGIQTEESLLGEFDQLTEREIEVLHLLAEGFTNKEIAEKLVVAPSTVKQHLKNIYSKLDVHSRTQAVARGRELNLF